MKLYRIPEPWDYHEQGGYVIMAESKREAVAKLKKWAKENRDYPDGPEYSKVELIKGDIYEESGCDC